MSHHHDRHHQDYHLDPRIVVVGSSNMDLITYTNQLPKAGETVKGHKFQTGFGGKGANQAVAAAKLGAVVNMIAKLGTDKFGKQMRKNLMDHEMPEQYLLTTEEVNSGIASITVSNDGTNNIIIVPGANELLSPQEIRNHIDAFTGSKVLLTQLEIPMPATIEALKVGKELGITTILNAAPAMVLPHEIFPIVDILCANEVELETMSGKAVTSVEDAMEASRILISRGATTVLVTLGSKGCLWVTSDTSIYQPLENDIKAVDTTGAGDCFLGAFAFFFARGETVEDALYRANAVAGYSVQREGTQKSFPRRNDLPEELFRNQI